MTYYAGLDVSLRTVNICVINDLGEFIAETKVDSEVTDVVAYFDGLVSDAQQDRQERCQGYRPVVAFWLVQPSAHQKHGKPPDPVIVIQS